MYNNELYHYGVKGMKWGVRRYRDQGGGIVGSIRRRQRMNAEKDLSKVKSKQKQIDTELRELQEYNKNPSKLGKSKISTAIRRNQIKSLNKTKVSLRNLERESVSVLKELDQIEQYQAKKYADKAMRKMNKTKIKDLQRQYGELEDRMTYGKNTDNKTNVRIEQQMIDIEKEIKQLRRTKA